MRSIFRTKLLVGVACALATVTAAWAQKQTFNFSGSTTQSWVAYVVTQLPVLNSGIPGSIADNPLPGPSFARTTNPQGAFPGPVWPGMTYTFASDLFITNNTSLRLEFSNVGHTSGLQFELLNSPTAGLDSLEVAALGGGAATLWSGNFGGAAGKDSGELFVALTFTVVPGSSANVTGMITESGNTLWFQSSPSLNLSLGSQVSPLYAAMNITSGGVGGIQYLSWAAVPEPGTVTLLSVLGGLMVLGLWFRGQRLKG